MPKSATAGTYGSYMFSYAKKKPRHSLPQSPVPFRSVWVIYFLCILSSIWCYRYFLSHSDVCGDLLVISIRIFLRMLAIYSCAYLPSVCPLLWNVCSCLYPFSDWIVCFLNAEFRGFFIYPFCSPLSDVWLAIVLFICSVSSFSPQGHPVKQKSLILQRPSLSVSPLMDHALVSSPGTLPLPPGPKDFLLCIFLKVLWLHFIFKSVIHFELVLYKVWCLLGRGSLFLSMDIHPTCWKFRAVLPWTAHAPLSKPTGAVRRGVFRGPLLHPSHLCFCPPQMPHYPGGRSYRTRLNIK